MKNEIIISAWDQINPDEKTTARMLTNIMEFQHSHARKAMETRPPHTQKANILSRRKYGKVFIPLAACLALAVATIAIWGLRQSPFGAKRYSVTLDTGEKFTYENGSPEGAASYAYEYDVIGRPLTKDEISLLLPSLKDVTDNDYASATFKAETGEMIRMEGRTGHLLIHLAKSGLPVTDTIVTGSRSITKIKDVEVKTGYFLTRPNSKNIRTAIFFAEFEANGTVVYVEVAGEEEESEELSRQLSEAICDMINGNLPDLSKLRMK